MKIFFSLLILVPSLSWGLTFSNGKQVGGNTLTPSNTFQIKLTKNPKEAFVYTNEISRAGEKSQKFVLKHNECGAEKGYDDCVNDAQRTERVPGDTDNYKGDVVYYGFSIFLPKDFPSIHPAAVTLGQVKNDGLSQPIWITRMRKDNFHIVTHWNDSECSLIKVDDMKGVWTDFIIKSDFSTKDKEGDVKTIVRKPGTNTYVTEYKNSYFSFIVESEHGDSDINPTTNLTEKTLIGLLTGTMPIILGGRGIISDLEKLGIKVWNNEFGFGEGDSYTNYSEYKIDSFIRCIENVNKLSLTEVKEYYNKNIKLIQSNYDLISYLLFDKKFDW